MSRTDSVLSLLTYVICLCCATNDALAEPRYKVFIHSGIGSIGFKNIGLKDTLGNQYPSSNQRYHCIQWPLLNGVGLRFRNTQCNIGVKDWVWTPGIFGQDTSNAAISFLCPFLSAEYFYGLSHWLQAAPQAGYTWLHAEVQFKKGAMKHDAHAPYLGMKLLCKIPISNSDDVCRTNLIVIQPEIACIATRHVVTSTVINVGYQFASSLANSKGIFTEPFVYIFYADNRGKDLRWDNAGVGFSFYFSRSNKQQQPIQLISSRDITCPSKK